MGAGQAAASAVILALLVRKGALTANEVLTALEDNQEVAERSILADTALPLRFTRQAFLDVQSKPKIVGRRA
jgi:hypothetical protein